MLCTSCSHAEGGLPTEFPQLCPQPDRWRTPNPPRDGYNPGSRCGWKCGQLGMVVEQLKTVRSCPPHGCRSPRLLPVAIHTGAGHPTSPNDGCPHNSQALLLLRTFLLFLENKKRELGAVDKWTTGASKLEPASTKCPDPDAEFGEHALRWNSPHREAPARTPSDVLRRSRCGIASPPMRSTPNLPAAHGSTQFSAAEPRLKPKGHP